ncbi:hypothetical protein GDO81_023738 [Engystomops pustulosus]|uniref:Solute carrier family 3 member 2 N-terminal domain-containing protein n=1 Tax=Engystomops pustulosus TaxID=76066 RepID=A0AAV6YKW5_ENGPU|nr:hypothetical protein GDO81_023738 [Engystomops pustulosus]
MVPAGMESQPLLGTHRAQQDTRFWVCVRRTLLILFWAAYITVVVFAVVLVIQAYHPPPPSAWHQRRVICRNTGPQQTGVTARIQAASVLGCGGLILSQDEVGEPGVKALVEEAQRYGVRTVLEVPLLEKYSRQQVQRLKDTARSWLQDGVSAFWLSGERRTTIMMVRGSQQKEAWL